MPNSTEDDLNVILHIDSEHEVENSGTKTWVKRESATPSITAFPMPSSSAAADDADAAGDADDDFEKETLPGASNFKRNGSKRRGSVAHTMKDFTKSVSKHVGPHGRVQLISEAKGTVNSIELYFDLIFVAAMFRLGTMYSDDYKSKRKDAHLEMGISFCVLWLTWHHVNMLYTRFSLDDNWKFVEYLIMLLALLLSVVMVSYEVNDCPSAYTNATASASAYTASCVVSGAAALNSTCSCADAASVAAAAEKAAGQAVFEATVWARPAVASAGFVLVWAASRFVNAVIYFVGGLQNKSARKMTMWYSICLLCSVLLLCISAVINDHDGYLAVATIVIVLETLMYPITILMTKKEDHLPIDVHHNIERAELWAILVLGESMLSLIHGSAQYIKYANTEFYFCIAISFTINFVLLKIYISSTPAPSSHDHRVPDLDTHAIDLSLIRSVFFDISQGVVTAFLFIFGVAIKFAVKYGHYKDGTYYIQDYAEMFSMACGCSLLTMTLSRMCHEWTDYPVFGQYVTRIRLWWVHIAMSALIIGLPYFTIDVEYGVDGGKATRTGISPLSYLFCVLGCVLIAVTADVLSRRKPDSLVADLSEYAYQTHQLKEGKLPDDISSDDIDADKVAANTRQALNVNAVRAPGQKLMRFSGRYMVQARQLRKTMGAFDNKPAAAGAAGGKAKGGWGARTSGASNNSSPAALGFQAAPKMKPSLFAVFKTVVDEQEPAHVMGSKNLAAKNWKIGMSKASIARQFSGGHNSGGAKLTLGKKSKMSQVAPAPDPDTSTSASQGAGLDTVPQEVDEEQGSLVSDTFA